MAQGGSGTAAHLTAAVVHGMDLPRGPGGVPEHAREAHAHGTAVFTLDPLGRRGEERPPTPAQPAQGLWVEHSGDEYVRRGSLGIQAS